MKRILLPILIALITFILLTDESKKKTLKTEESKVITISFVCDLMCHEPQYEFARRGNDSFNFRPTFSEVKKIFSSSDYVIGNLETVVKGTGTKLGSYPFFNSPIEFLDAIKDAGFNILITSNNHCLDQGINGLEKMISNLDKFGFNHLGTYKDLQDRDSIRIFNKQGIHLAVLSYTYGVNGNFILPRKKFAVNLIDTSLIRKDIFSARKKNADVVIVYFHFGEEYERFPNKFQREIVELTKNFGADIIIASHPHVIQPLEFFVPKSGKLDRGFVAYSLGNFISNQRWRYSDCGVILNFSLEKMNENKIVLDTISIIPTWVFKGNTGNQNSFVIIPSDTSYFKNFPDYITNNDKEKILQSFNDTKRTLAEVLSFKRKAYLHSN